ncbi:MAG: MATE family efflux transporter [Hyphomicrobiales bacterium]
MKTSQSADIAPKFCTGSTMRHVLIMTSTASVGLMSVFLVDFLNLFYISMLGMKQLAAAVGYAGTILFFLTSIAIGIMIATTAIVSRAIGRGDRAKARLLAGSSVVIMFTSMALISAMFFPFIESAIALVGAEGETLQIAKGFLQIVVPSVPILGISLVLAGILRAAGDAKRAMYATLGTGVFTAFLDPLLIFGFDLGVTGAAISTALSRLGSIGIALYSVIKIHDMLAFPPLRIIIKDVHPCMIIAIPAILANISTPVANAYVTSSIAQFGDGAVSGWAFIGRLIPLAFGLIFALSGAIGPIIGQNYGAVQYDRVRQTVIDSLVVTVAYTAIIWLFLFITKGYITTAFHLDPEATELVIFFINIVIVTFLFNGALFVANATFNNLGYATYSTVLNWGKATIGTIPFVWAGAHYYGAKGAILGQGIGYVVFGVAGVFLCYRVINAIAASQGQVQKELDPTIVVPNIPEFSSGKCAGICVHSEVQDMKPKVA